MVIDTKKELLDYISSEWGLKNTSIELELEYDLGLTGEEAEDFITHYSEKFNVDVSKFVITDYFSSEGLHPIFFIKRLFKKKKKNSLHIKDLIRGIETGYLE